MIVDQSQFKFTDYVLSFQQRLINEWLNDQDVRNWSSMNAMSDDLGKSNVEQGYAWKTSPHKNMGYRIYPDAIKRYPKAWEMVSHFGHISWCAGYSFLDANSKIDTHQDYDNTGKNIRIHIPLVLPDADMEHLGLRVNGVDTAWEKDKLLIFDNSLPHSAWNFTDSIRVIYLFDLPKEYCLL